MDISVIIPVYNAEKYLVRCLDSICCQIFSGTFEIIAVDDASTDKSLLILKEYEKNNDKIRVIEHQVNKKLSVARSSGINAAKGDYIMHVDSDDWIVPNTLNTLYQEMKKNNPDVIVYNYFQINDKGKRKDISLVKNEFITTDKLKVNHLFYGSAINKIVKKELTSNLITGKIGINLTEDLLYCTEILLKAKTIQVIPEYLYAYYSNDYSLTKTININQLLNNQLTVLDELNKIFNKQNAEFRIIRNTLKYLYNSIINAIFQARFINRNRVKYNAKLISAFSNFKTFSDEDTKMLKKVMRNNYYSIPIVYKNLGFKPILYTLYFRIKLYLKINNA